jgi:hypothetical protein
MDYREHIVDRALPVADALTTSTPSFFAMRPTAESAREDAIPFDAPHLPEVKLNHRGPRCSFEAIIEDYHLQAPGLARLALIVRAADIKGQEQVAVEGIGLRAIAQGFAALGLSDQERLARQFPVYDALYEYARQTP